MSVPQNPEVMYQARRVLSHTLSALGNIAQAADVSSNVLVLYAQDYEEVAAQSLAKTKAMREV